MAKAKKKKAKAGKVGEKALVERAKGISSELATIRDAEQSRLQAILTETDDVLRQTIILEAEITHHNVRRQELEEQLRGLRGEGEKIQGIVDALENQRKKGEIRLDEMGSSVTGLRRKIDSTKKATDKLGKERIKLNKEITQLGKEQKKMDKEVNSLGNQKSRLEEDIKRLKKLREEYMAVIAEFEHIKKDLAPK